MTPDESIAGLPCNLCGGVCVSVLSQRSRSGDPLRTVACRQCGLVWSDPRPHDTRRFYAQDYRLAYKRTHVPRARHVLRAGRVALSRLEKIRPCLQGRMRILDVGSGGGEFAYLLKSLGHEVHGVEPNNGYAAYAATQYGLHVTQGFIGDIDLPPAGYDLITIWHVLEHTDDPGAVLRQLHRALRRGGLLVVEVPNVEAACQSPHNTFHEAHLYNFNAATLSWLAARADLQPCVSEHSADGGNLIAIFRSVNDAATPMPVGLTQRNHERVANRVGAHRPLRYWLSAHPYRRAAGRLARMATEWMQTREPRGARERLDALYASNVQPAASAAHAKKHALWLWVAGAYAAALLLEWLLLDRMLPTGAWGERQALALYLALQSAMVAGVVWVTNMPRTMPQIARLAAWAAPMFALPIFC